MKKLISLIVLIQTILFLAPSFGQNIGNSENDNILYMMEEEKMARDVYQIFYDKWEYQMFDNIASSEQMHLNKMKVLTIDHELSLTNSVSNDQVGSFDNSKLQDLYDQLVKEGSLSLEDAIRVGAKIEEVDIQDLNAAISATEDDNSVYIYTQLRNASENHLRAFVRNLNKLEIEYTPSFLSTADFENIIDGKPKKGKCEGKCIGKCKSSSRQ